MKDSRDIIEIDGVKHMIHDDISMVIGGLCKDKYKLTVWNKVLFGITVGLLVLVVYLIKLLLND